MRIGDVVLMMGIDSERGGSGGAVRAVKVTPKTFVGVSIWELEPVTVRPGIVFLFDGETDFCFLHSEASRRLHDPIGENNDSSELILKLLDVLDDDKVGDP